MVLESWSVVPVIGYGQTDRVGTDPQSVGLWPSGLWTEAIGPESVVMMVPGPWSRCMVRGPWCAVYGPWSTVGCRAGGVQVSLAGGGRAGWLRLDCRELRYRC